MKSLLFILPILLIAIGCAKATAGNPTPPTPLAATSFDAADMRYCQRELQHRGITEITDPSAYARLMNKCVTARQNTIPARMKAYDEALPGTDELLVRRLLDTALPLAAVIALILLWRNRARRKKERQMEALRKL